MLLSKDLHLSRPLCYWLLLCRTWQNQSLSHPDTYPTTQHWIQVETPTGTGLRWWNNVVRRWLELLGYQESFCEDVMNNNYLLEKPKTEEPLVRNALNPYPKLSNTWDWSKLNRRGCPAKWFCPDHAFGCLPMKKTSSEVQLWTWQGTFFHTVSDTCLCFVLSSHLHHHMSSLSVLQFTLGVDESLMMLILNTLPPVQCPKWASEVHRFALLTVTSLTPQGPACLPSTSRFPATFEPWHVAQSKPSALTAAARLGKAKLRRKLVTSRASRGWSNSPADENSGKW